MELTQYNQKLLSSVIEFLRFPLIIGVVFIHSEPNLFYDGEPGIYFKVFNSLLSCLISGCAVPLFFLFSGYLFFNSDFSIPVYINKLRKRVRTILIPYILWNLIVFGLLLLSQIVFTTSELTARLETPIQFLNIFWTFRSGYPMCAQFWFLRDLMMMFLISPILYVAIKNLRLCFIGLLLSCWIFDIWYDVAGFSLKAVLFFSIGAYFGIFKINFVVKSLNYLKQLMSLYLGLIVTILCIYDNIYESNLWPATTAVGIFAILGLTAHFIKSGKWQVNIFLAESSFFIYAYHQIFLGMLTKRTLPFFIRHNVEIGMCVSYLICPVVIICIGLLLYMTMKHYMPYSIDALTGARTKVLPPVSTNGCKVKHV